MKIYHDKVVYALSILHINIYANDKVYSWRSGGLSISSGRVEVKHFINDIVHGYGYTNIKPFGPHVRNYTRIGE